ESELAEPVKRIPTLICRIPRRQYPEFRGGFRVQQEQDAVEEPKGLHRERLGLILRQGRQVLRPTAGDHLAGYDFDRLPHTLAKVLRHPDGVADRLFENLSPPDRPIGARGERFRSNARERAFHLSPAFGVVAL